MATPTDTDTVRVRTKDGAAIECYKVKLKEAGTLIDYVATQTLAQFVAKADEGAYKILSPVPANGPATKDIDSHEALTFYPLSTKSGVKHDGSKLPMDLLDPLALEGLTAVLQFGAQKYAAHNWRGGLKWTRLIAAMLRHSFAILRGELNDPESGLPHVDHVGCCWMFLSNMMKTRPDLNDIYQKEESMKPK